MKLKVNRDHFVTGLQQVLNVVGTRATMPILSNVFMEAKEGTLTLTTTNLDMGIRCSVQADIETSGSITLPVRKLATIAKALPASEVEIDASMGAQAKITSGGALFRIMGIASDEFPPLPELESKSEYTFQQEELQQMIKSIAYAQSGDESRYILNGIYFNFLTDRITLVATDGRRLGIVHKDLEKETDVTGSIIVPAKTVSELTRLLGCGEQVRVAFSDRQVAFYLEVDEEKGQGLSGAVYLVSKIVEGKYPDYNQVIPKQTEYRVKLERELVQECVQRVALVTNDKSNSVKVNIRSNQLEVTGSSSEYGEARESMAIVYDGPDVEVAFNPQFLLDPLKALSRDEVFFEFKDELSPGVIKTLDNFLCVVMPLRLH